MVVAGRSAESVIPEAFPESRYQALIARSPFGIPTPVAAPVVQDKTFADGWYLAGATQVDGKDFVTVRARNHEVFFSLHGDAPSEQDGPGLGVKLQRVEWSPTLGRTTASIEKDGQTVKLEMLQPSEMPAAAPAPMPGANPLPGARPAPGARPVTSFPQPNAAGPARTTIPRPSNTLVSPQPSSPITPGQQMTPAAQPGAQTTTQPADGRRRIRMINSAPAQ